MAKTLGLLFLTITNIFAVPLWIPPTINGFFVQPTLGYGVADFEGNFATQEFYDGWVKSMADIGATMLFYQWTVHYEENQTWFSDVYGGESSGDFAYYNENLKRIGDVAVNSWMPAIRVWTNEDVTPVKRLLDAGEKNGVDIWLGLYLSERGQFNWWNAVNDNTITSQDSATFRYHVERSVDLVRDLLEQYGAHPALGGFYYPIEIANLGFEKEENWPLLAWLLDSVATEVHKLSNKQLAISPFFNVALTPAEEWGRMWDYVLANSAIDIIILQDGVGVEPHTISEISPFFAAVKNASFRNKKQFWGNAELFTNTSGDRGNMQASPASIDQIRGQLEIMQYYTNTFVCFSFLSMDTFVQKTPFDGAGYPLSARRKLYNDYKAYYEYVKSLENGSKNQSRRSQSLRSNLSISVSGSRISLNGLQGPTPYEIISPNGQVVFRGTAENGVNAIPQLAGGGVYIFTLRTANGARLSRKFLNGLR